MRVWPVAGKCLLVAGLILVLRLTSDPFLMVMGSESTSVLISPAVTVQVVCVIVVAAALFVPARPVVRGILGAVALCAALLGGHRLVIDNLNHGVRDVWLAIPVQSMPLDPMDEAGLKVTWSRMGFRIQAAGSGFWCLSPPLIGLNRTAVQAAARNS